MLDLTAIKARDKARTQGKWRATGPTHRGGFTFGANEILYGGTTIVCWNGFDSADGTKQQKRRNARFIAACSVDVPALIREVERLREGLRTIADMADKTVLGPSRQDYVVRQNIDECQAHEIGANKAFGQCAQMARALLGKE